MAESTLKSQKYSTTAYLMLSGLFAAVVAICSWIFIPLPFTPIPINLGTLAIFLTGGLLGWKYGFVSIMVYVLLGAVGVPVFHGFTGGLGIIAGPTGGYIIGYLLAVFLIGLLMDSFPKKNYFFTAISLTSGLLICYFFGTVWFMISTKAGLGASLLLCVVPFLLGDMIKITAATILVKKLRPFLQ